MKDLRFPSDAFVAPCLFLILVCFYVSGLCGTVPAYRDSGDLIAAAHALGIAHPPGYSLYVVLGNIFGRMIPWANYAYRMNLWSALAMAAAAALLFGAIAKRFGPEGRWGAAAASLAFAATPAASELARVAEMYGLAALWAAALVLCLLNPTVSSRRIAWFLLGLGLAVQPILLFLVPLFLASARTSGSAFPRVAGDDERALSGASVLAFLCGLSIFCFLPLRALQEPSLNWGDPSTWRNFWRVVTRADYGGLKLHPEQSVLRWSIPGLAEQTFYFFRTHLREWGIVGMLLGLAGLGVGLFRRSQRSMMAGIALSWILSGPGFFILSNLPQTEPTTPAILQPYLVQASLLWSVLAAGGLWALWNSRRWAGGVAAVLLLVEIGLLPRLSHRSDLYAYDYGRDLLHSLPPRAVLFDPDDPTAFTLRMLQVTEGRRPDVVLLNYFRTRWGYEEIRRRWPDLLPGIPMESAQQLESAFWGYSAGRRSFYAELPQKLGSQPYRSQGLVYAARPAAPDTVHAKGIALLSIYRRRGHFRTTQHQDFFTRHLLGYYAAAYSNLGLDEAGTGAWEEAVHHYKAALSVDPELSAAYNNWGIVCYERKEFAKAVELYQAALALSRGNPSLERNIALAQAAITQKSP